MTSTQCGRTMPRDLVDSEVRVLDDFNGKGFTETDGSWLFTTDTHTLVTIHEGGGTDLRDPVTNRTSSDSRSFCRRYQGWVVLNREQSWTGYTTFHQCLPVRKTSDNISLFRYLGTKKEGSKTPFRVIRNLFSQLTEVIHHVIVFLCLRSGSAGSGSSAAAAASGQSQSLKKEGLLVRSFLAGRGSSAGASVAGSGTTQPRTRSGDPWSCS